MVNESIVAKPEQGRPEKGEDEAVLRAERYRLIAEFHDLNSERNKLAEMALCQEAMRRAAARTSAGRAPAR
jgi:hypothetical protein